MHVRIIQAGDDRAATAVDHFRSRSTLPQDFISRTDSADFAIFDSERFDKRRNSIRRYPRVVQYTVGFHAWLLIDLFRKDTPGQAAIYVKQPPTVLRTRGTLLASRRGPLYTRTRHRHRMHRSESS